MDSYNNGVDFEKMEKDNAIFLEKIFKKSDGKSRRNRWYTRRTIRKNTIR